MNAPKRKKDRWHNPIADGREKDMSSSRNLGKMNIVEMRLYELLGIKLFRKVILLFERIKHIGDGGQNENYHPQDMSCSTLRRFSGYLIYNSLFHAISLMLIAIYFATTRIVAIENIVIDVVMVVVVILDAYCLMLQRYIYLRFLQHINKKQQIFLNTKADKITGIIECLKNKSAKDINNEKEFLEDLKAKILSGSDVLLADDSEEVLWNICEVLNRKPKDSNEKRHYDISFSDLISELPKKTNVISFKKRCVSRLQRVLRFSEKDNVMYGVCVVTGNPNIETAYKRIFPQPSLDSILETTDMLLDAYHWCQEEMVRQ